MFRTKSRRAKSRKPHVLHRNEAGGVPHRRSSTAENWVRSSAIPLPTVCLQQDCARARDTKTGCPPRSQRSSKELQKSRRQEKTPRPQDVVEAAPKAFGA